jgi:hypothetical protein
MLIYYQQPVQAWSGRVYKLHVKSTGENNIEGISMIITSVYGDVPVQDYHPEQ